MKSRRPLVRLILSVLLSGLFWYCNGSPPVSDGDTIESGPVDPGFDNSKLDCNQPSKFLSSQELGQSDLILQVFDGSKAFLFRKTVSLPESLKHGGPIRLEWDQKNAEGRMLGAGKYTLKYTYRNEPGADGKSHFGCEDVEIRVGDYAAYEHYTDSTHGIPNAFYRAVAVDSKNNVWFITSDNLIKYSGAFEKIGNPLPSKFFFKLAVNGKDEPVVMFASNGTDGGGVLAFYDGDWTFHDHSNSPIPDRTIFRAFESKQGELWISTADGVLSLKDSAWIPRHEQNPLFAEGASAFGDYDSLGIYMGIGDVSSSYQLYYYDGSSLKAVTGRTTRFPEHNQIFSLDFAPDGTLWIAMREYLPTKMEGGLVKFQNGEFTHYSGANSALPGNAVEFALITNNGKVVLATDGHGVGLFDEKEYKTILDGIDVTDMKMDYDGNLWVTTFAHGIYRFPYDHEATAITIAIPAAE